MKPFTVYIAGPMSGIPSFNIPAFDAVADELRQLDVRMPGYEEVPLKVVSPAELDGDETRAALLASERGDHADLPPGETWGFYLARDVRLLADEGIDAVVVLPGWEFSKGARLETYVANALLGLPVLRHTGEDAFMNVSKLELYRAWTADPHLVIRTAPFKP